MIAQGSTEAVEVRHFHLFSGSGSGAWGFNQGHARVGKLEARFRCIGGVDVDPIACKDFARLVGVPASCLDLFDAEQYTAFHGKPPPAGWRPVDADAIRKAAGGEFPHLVFLSAPCKGFSGLLNTKAAASLRYQALNRLTLRGIRLMLDAFADDLPELVIFENVPRIRQRGRDLLDDIVHELELAGFVTAETEHDCGVIGGLAQHRRRFLLVARNAKKVRPFLYEPPRQRVRAVGEVIGPMPLPDDARAGAMHRSPRLQWRTWMRLALIPAGGDWRSLQDLDHTELRVERLRPWGRGDLGVTPWDGAASTIAGESWPRNGRFSVADPRTQNEAQGGQRYNHVYRITRWDEAAQAVTGATGNAQGAVADPRGDTTMHGGGKYRVTRMDEATGAVIAESGTGNGAFAVADHRPPMSELWNDGHAYGVTDWKEPSPTVTGKAAAGGGYFSVADPRLKVGDDAHAHMRVEGWEDPAHTVTGSDRVGSGALSIADPRLTWSKQEGGDFGSSGVKHYGVRRWEEPSDAVIGHAKHNNGAWSVADPRVGAPGIEADDGPLPDDDARCLPLIIATDGTWHRPFTTLELAALQGFPWELFVVQAMAGTSDAKMREHIGNAVPGPAAAAIASTMGKTLLLNRAGVAFMLSAESIWVQPLAIALSVASQKEALA